MHNYIADVAFGKGAQPIRFIEFTSDQSFLSRADAQGILSKKYEGQEVHVTQVVKVIK